MFAPPSLEQNPGLVRSLTKFRRMNPDQIWPDALYIVRHGESAGNVAREAALLAGEREIDIGVRDVDVPLSKLGEQQAAALGRSFPAIPHDKKPNPAPPPPSLPPRPPPS